MGLGSLVDKRGLCLNLRNHDRRIVNSCGVIEEYIYVGMAISLIQSIHNRLCEDQKNIWLAINR